MYMYSTYLFIYVIYILTTQVSEINVYITEVESDVRGVASLTLSQTNRFIVWPEVSQVYVCILVLLNAVLSPPPPPPHVNPDCHSSYCYNV